MKAMFFAIEINLILWLALLGATISPLAESPHTRWILPVIGAGLTAVLQHWAYYRLYRTTREIVRPS